jgi:ketosteroid isomerase-like protein
VSQENVEIVLQLQPAPEMDLAQLFRDDATWATVATALSTVLAPDVQIAAPDFFDFPEAIDGVDGLRAAWLQWLSPWESYRAEVEDAIDCGDAVLLLIRDYGRRTNENSEIPIHSAAVWRFRGGRVARVEFYAHRAMARQAVGLEE